MYSGNLVPFPRAGRDVALSSSQKSVSMVTPRSFKNGCYHELADQQQIGWHPNYKQKLKEDEKDV